MTKRPLTTKADRQPREEDQGLADLLARARSGDFRAQGEFFDRTFRRLRDSLTGQGVYSDADDYAQVALTQAYTSDSAVKLNNDGGVFSWLMTVAMNEFRSDKRQRRLHQLALSVLTEVESSPGDSDSEFEQVLQEALRNLDPKHSGALALLCSANKKTAVAELLGINESTVRWRCEVAMKQIADYIREHRPDIYDVRRKYFGFLEGQGHE